MFRKQNKLQTNRWQEGTWQSLRPFNPIRIPNADDTERGMTLKILFNLAYSNLCKVNSTIISTWLRITNMTTRSRLRGRYNTVKQSYFYYHYCKQSFYTTIKQMQLSLRSLYQNPSSFARHQILASFLE